MTTLRTLRYTYNETITDADIVWTVQLHHSYAQLDWCLSHLRAIYPDARVVLIADGDGVDYGPLASRYGCTYHEGQHWMTLEHSHLYVRRLLTLSLNGNETYCFRIDPDTRVWRRFTRLPAFSAIFGTLETISEGQSEIRVPANVQGGCLGLTRDAAAAILESGHVNEINCGERALQTWARCRDMRIKTRRGSCSDDFILSWAAHECGIPLVECAEIRSRWRRHVTNVGLQYAVTHPHKLAAAPLP
jgi:hypothetical protein